MIRFFKKRKIKKQIADLQHDAEFYRNRYSEAVGHKERSSGWHRCLRLTVAEILKLENELRGL